MHLNSKSEWKAMTIYISRELPLFNFERLDILCTWIEHPSEKLWPFQFLESFFFQFRVSRYIMHLNQTTVWKDMTIWISWELPLFNFGRLDILCVWTGHLCEKLLPFKFLESFRFSVSSAFISYAPESDICVKSYDQLNFSSASVVQFQASGYIMCLDRTSV